MPTEPGVRGPRNRPRARFVCTQCRSRKIKCDAEKLPRGSPCTPCQSNKSKCHIEPDSDRRRHSAANHRFAEMQQRIQSLEAMVKPGLTGAPVTQRQEEPAAVPQYSTQRVESSLPLGEHEMHPSTPEDTIVVQTQLTQPMHAPTRQTGVTFHAPPAERAPSVPVRAPPLPTCPPTANLSPLVAGTDLLGPTTDNQANRSGLCHMSNASESLDLEEGTPRVIYRHAGTEDVAFYGSTTQSHLHSPPDDLVTLEVEDQPDEHRAMNMDSTQLRKTLLDNFFRLQPYSQVIVHEQLFRRDRPQYLLSARTTYYSDFLESAMLASAARHSTSAEVRALGLKYAARAKNQIPSELDQPNIASLQAFLLLSDSEATRGRARTGWTYCSIAAGLLVDLALHVDPANYAEQSIATHLEVEFRSTLLLGTFVYATLWSLYLGRPSSISSPVLLAVRRLAAAQSPNNTFYMWVQLCLRMLDIIEILNAQPTDRSLDHNMHLCFHELNLRSAFERVPVELAFDDSRIEELDAGAYTPHIQYFGMQITVHRAMARAGPGQSLARDNLRPKSLDYLHASIHEYVLRIAKLILSYQRIFGTENMVTVMLDNIYVAAVALLAHVLRTLNPSRVDDGDVRWLSFFLTTLASVEKHFPIARRMRSTLEQMITKSPLGHLFPKLLPQSTAPSAPNNLAQSAYSDALNNTPQQHHNHDHHQSSLESATFDLSEQDVPFTTEDNTWTQYLAWNMPLIPNMSDFNQTSNLPNSAAAGS